MNRERVSRVDHELGWRVQSRVHLHVELTRIVDRRRENTALGALAKGLAGTTSVIRCSPLAIQSESIRLSEPCTGQI